MSESLYDSISVLPTSVRTSLTGASKDDCLEALSDRVVILEGRLKAAVELANVSKKDEMDKFLKTWTCSDS